LVKGELAGWLVWLPGSERLLAGPADISRYAGYAIDAQTGAARPFSWRAGAGQARRAPLQAGEPVGAVAGERARERAPGQVRT
jgi:hypothetical protein